MEEVSEAGKPNYREFNEAEISSENEDEAGFLDEQPADIPDEGIAINVPQTDICQELEMDTPVPRRNPLRNPLRNRRPPQRFGDE